MPRRRCSRRSASPRDASTSYFRPKCKEELARAIYELVRSDEWVAYELGLKYFPEYSNYANCAGRTALSHAVQDNRSTTCSKLLAEPLFGMANEQDQDGWTALHWAARCGHVVVTQQLLACPRFTSIYARDHDGCTVLEIAWRFHKHDAAQILAAHQPRPHARVNELTIPAPAEPAELAARISVKKVIASLRALPKTPELHAMLAPCVMRSLSLAPIL